MSDGSGDGLSLAGAYAAANASLRETAKWLVGGVVGASAAIFAGSSLTKLGSLNAETHGVRLLLAIGGAGLGFVALGLILARAINVLQIEPLTIESVATGEGKTLVRVRHRIEKHYRGMLPGKAKNLRELVQIATKKWETRDPKDLPFVMEYLAYHREIMAQASFWLLQARFRKTVHALWIGGPLAIVGFGLFAWAANPPEDKPASKPPVLQINLP